MSDTSTAESKNTAAPQGAENPGKSTPAGAENAEGQKYDPLTNAFRGGINEAQERFAKKLQKLGVQDFDDLERKWSELSGARKQVEEFKENPAIHPEYKKLQSEAEQLRKQNEQLANTLKQTRVNDAIDALAAQSRNPRLARLAFMDEFNVQVADDGSVKVLTKDGYPALLGKDGQPAPLQQVFNDWFGKQLDLQRGSETTGSGAAGSGGAERVFSREEIAKMSPAEFKANYERIVEQMKSAPPLR